jgi:Na+(H+)/acetate symporter ActP
MIPFLFVVAIIVATVVIGVVATKKSKTASDFFVAGRSVSVFWNASAISGEYLSAASFMGVAGLIMKNGYDALWYPVGYAAGYLFLLLFIAGPLRRFGAYTIPDFAQGRFDSATFRKVAVTFVLFIGFFYTMPQMKGAGVTMASILGWPYWAGILAVGSVITFNVALGGMKGITVVQAFQYWVKVFAISLPVFVLLAVLGHGTPDSAKAPQLPQATTVKMKGAAAVPNNAMVMTAGAGIQVKAPVKVKVGTSAKTPATPGAPSPLITGDGQVLAYGDQTLEPGVRYTTAPTEGTPPKIEFQDPADVTVDGGPEGTAVPNAPSGAKWENPFGPLTSKHGHPLLYTYSLIIALVCGTAGLPHILVRFYTNPDGRAAKRTTLWVMVMLGAFYVFTPVWGTVGRALMPSLYAANATDLVVIKLPTILENKLLGEILSGVTSAGAFAAFMSTFSGLLVSMSGAFAHDIYGKILRPGASDTSRLTMFKYAAIAIGILSMGLGLLVESFDIAMMVGWAFAIGAASYFPLLLLGSWWRGLTKYGAAAGMLLGGLLSLSAIVASMLLDKKVLTMTVSPLVRSLMEQPAIWGVPLSLLTMVVVSKMTAKSIPADVDTKMLRLHAPEEMGLSRDYVA